MIRVAAVGDLHAGTDSVGLIGPRLADVTEHADVLLLAGDLTRIGTLDEIDVLLGELAGLALPKVAVLGNHDHHAGMTDELVGQCEAEGVRVLEGEAEVIELAGGTLGVAGIKGFCGGFPGTSLSPFGEAEIKAFAETAHVQAARLGQALGQLDTDHVIALMHYSPVRDTVIGEPLEIYPFLGCGCFAEAIDAAGADLVVHGHAHHGTEQGMTPGGIPVRNVAQPLIGDCYRVFHLTARPSRS